MFASAPPGEVSSAEIAREAGVTRGLIHHYFGGVSGLFVAVMQELLAEGSAIPRDIPGLSREERVARNFDRSLDLIEASREPWLGVANYGEASSDPQIRAVIDAAKDALVTAMIEVNSDLLSDTPATRAVLHGQLEMQRSVCTAWLEGRISRGQVHRLLTDTFLRLVEETIPALEAQ